MEMTKLERMTIARLRMTKPKLIVRHSSFGLYYSSFDQISSFILRHFGAGGVSAAKCSRDLLDDVLRSRLVQRDLVVEVDLGVDQLLGHFQPGAKVRHQLLDAAQPAVVELVVAAWSWRRRSSARGLRDSRRRPATAASTPTCLRASAGRPSGSSAGRCESPSGSPASPRRSCSGRTGWPDRCEPRRPCSVRPA